MPRLFIHGLEGTSRGFKAVLLRSRFPDLLTPDFTGPLEERMAALEPLLAASPQPWTLIGSSFGGLMATLFTCAHPERVRQLVLLAPALHLPEVEAHVRPVDVPTVLIHGTRDEVVPLEPVRRLAARIFRHLELRVVDDVHALKATTETLDWRALLAPEAEAEPQP
jgi:pimeloyl-ACP methyl ester carboxylesterase